MDYMFPSITNENLSSSLITSHNLIIHDQNVNLSGQEDPRLFLQFPSPNFLDDMDTTTTETTQQNHPNTVTATTTTTEQFASKLKCVRKKRSAGKKDRHSKIHTAQGLRDRRMRLSVHTARKFFDLNDMLGFDKASKTIEWLFSKSKEAIDEVVTENLQPADDAALILTGDNNEIKSPLSACETESLVEIVAAGDQDGENLELQDDQIIENSSRSELMESYPLMVTELSGKEAINNFQQSQFGYLEHHLHHNMEESSSSSGGYPVEFSNTYHFLKQLHLDNISNDHVIRNTYNNSGNINSASIPPAETNPNFSIFDYNKSINNEPPAGWLNSKNTFLGFLGGWDDSEIINSRLIMGSNNGNYNIAPLIGSSMISRDDNSTSASSGIISSCSYRNFHSENHGRQ